MSNIIKTEDAKRLRLASFHLPEISENHVHSREFRRSSAFSPLKYGDGIEAGVREHSSEETDLLAKEAEDRAVLIEKEAYERGFNKGEKEGFESGQQKAETIINNLSRILSDMDGYKEKIFKEAREEIIKMVLTICRKVVSHELSTNQEVIISSVKEALRYVTDKSGVYIRVNPEDLRYLNSFKEDLAKFVEGLKHLEIVGDEAIKRGGCIVETGFETINGRIEHKLDTIARVVEKELRKDGSAEDRSK